MEDRNFDDLCDDIQILMMELDEKILQLVPKDTPFIHPFRQVRDRLLLELKVWQQKYLKFHSDSRNDEQLNYLEQQLTFFRQSSHTQNELRKELQIKLDKMDQTNKCLLQEKEEQIKVLHRLTDENLTLKNTMVKLREQNVIHLKAMNETQQYFKERDTQENPQKQQILTPISTFTNRRKFLPSSRDKSSDKLEEISQSKSKERTPAVTMRSVKRELQPLSNMNETFYESDLRKLFKQCVNTLMQDIQIRKLAQQQKRRLDDVQRNSQNEFKDEDDKIFVKVTKFDQRQLIEKFFSSKQFLQIVEAQIFNKICCSNPNCLYNFKKRTSNDESFQLSDDSKRNQLLTKIKDGQVDQKFQAIKKECFSTYQIGKTKDDRLEYQLLIAELKSLERALLNVPQKDKQKVSRIQIQMNDIQEKIVQLSQQIKNKELSK